MDLQSDKRAPQGRIVWMRKRKPGTSSALWKCGNRARGDFQGRWATVGNSTSSQNSRNSETRVFHRRPPPGISKALFGHASGPRSIAISVTHRFRYRALITSVRLTNSWARGQAPLVLRVARDFTLPRFERRRPRGAVLQAATMVREPGPNRILSTAGFLPDREFRRAWRATAAMYGREASPAGTSICRWPSPN